MIDPALSGPDLLEHASLYSCTDPDLRADPDQAHVWRVDLDLEAGRIASLERFLCPEEHARAARFRSPGDRRRFVAAHGSLRAILAHYLRVGPAQVSFAYAPEGKPILAGAAPLHFNLSHSDSLALLAVSPRREVGIDVERLRADFAPEPLAKRFFSPSECEALSRVPPDERHPAFLRLWTLKEAYLKALGTGLTSPLNAFTVSLDDYSVQAFGVAAPYHLRPLDPAPGYVGALALASGPQG